MINVVIGRLGKDAEIGETSGGTKYVKFTVAENNYRNGEDKTTWYDVTSYDNFVVNTQIKVLKKGAFVVIVGDVDSKINVGKNGKIYLNHNITASAIKVPNLGNNNRTSEPENNVTKTTIESVSVGNLPPTTTSTPQVAVPEVHPVVQQINEVIPDDDGDDLPF